MTTPRTRPERSLWHDRGFALLAAAHAASQAGSQISLIALPLLALTVLHATPAQVGLLTAAETAGFLLVGLPAGVWVDRLAKKPVMVVTDLVRAVALGSIPAAHLAGVLTLAQLYAAGLTAGVATVFFQIAYQSYLPVLVPDDRLVEGNTKLQTIYSAAEVGGPGAGGWLVRLAGAPFAVALDAASFLVSALLLAGIKATEQRPARQRRGLWREMREGLSFVLRHPLLWRVTVAAALANLWVTALIAMTPVYFVSEAGVGFGTYGTVVAIGSVGAIIGAMTTAWQQRVVGSARMLWVNALAAAAGLAMVPLAVPGWRLGFAVAGIFLEGYMIAGWAVASVSLRQRLTPPELMARVNATARFVNWGTMPAGAALGGLFAQLTSARTTLFVFSTAYVTAALPILLSPLRRLRDLPQEAGVQT